MPKICIVEDDENIRDLVIYALDSTGFDAIGYECGKEFFKELEIKQPNLVLLDIMLPGEDGLSILKKIRKNKTAKKLPVIMLTAKGSEFDKVKGLDLGADDYIVKPFSVLELISRVKALLRRVEDDSKDYLKYKEIELDVKRYLVSTGKENITLTHKEFELLNYLMINQGIVLSRKNIMDCIWGFDYEGETRTVDMHIKTLRQKLGQSGEYIKTIRSVGYKLGDN